MTVPAGSVGWCSCGKDKEIDSRLIFPDFKFSPIIYLSCGADDGGLRSKVSLLWYGIVVEYVYEGVCEFLS